MGRGWKEDGRRMGEREEEGKVRRVHRRQDGVLVKEEGREERGGKRGERESESEKREEPRKERVGEEKREYKPCRQDQQIATSPCTRERRRRCVRRGRDPTRGLG